MKYLKETTVSNKFNF